MNILSDILVQLEEIKFRKLCKYFLDSPYEPFEVIDLEKTELWHSQKSTISQIEPYEFWHVLSQFSYSPLILKDVNSVRKLFIHDLTQTFNSMSKFPELEDFFYPQSGKFRSGGMYAACNHYHFITNLDHRFFHSEEPNNIFRKLASKSFKGFEDSMMVLGAITPKTLIKKSGYKTIMQHLVDLLNLPSSYYIIAREGQVAIRPVTYQGLYMASQGPSYTIDTVDLGLSTTISSILTPSIDIQQTLQNFESLVSDRGTKENDIQSFLEDHSEILMALDERYCEVRPHICLIDKSGYRLIPDFMIRLNDSNLWDLVELKSPFDPILIDKHDSVRASSSLAHGIAQLLRYRDFFENADNRRKISSRYGISSYDPCLILVIGRGKNHNLYEWREIRSMFPKVQVVSYDYLSFRAKECHRLITRY